jgi:ribosomal-protein-alanine N-acetyltransferase
MLPALQTTRLDLRPCRGEDVDALHALWLDPDVRRYLWDDMAIERAATEEVVQALLDAADKRGIGLWLLYPRGETDLAGFCALREIDGTREVELLYGLAREHWGRGLATEASRAVLSYGFQTAALAHIWARTDPPNAASIAVIERLGMRPAENPGREALPILAYVLDRP